MSGPRTLTFFFYFNDVQEGGETWFDKLGITVKPEEGGAVMWPVRRFSPVSKIGWFRGVRWVRERYLSSPEIHFFLGLWCFRVLLCGALWWRTVAIF
jgi:hypothetical protein